MGDGGVGSGLVDSGCHQLSENIWFVWSKTSFDGGKWRCYHGYKQTTNDKRKVKIELVSHSTKDCWTADFRN